MNSCRRLPILFRALALWIIFQLGALKASAQSDDYNIKIGDLLLDFSVFVQYSYNDNVTTVPENAVDRLNSTIIGPRSDYILSYGANIAFDWQISDNNNLGLIFGMSYDDYQDLDYLDSQRNFFSIKPESEIDFVLLLGPVEARIYDRFGYTVDGSNSVIVAETPTDPGGDVDGDDRNIIQGESVNFGVDRYSYWSNELGIELLTTLNPFEWTVGLRRYDLMPDDNDGGEFIDELGRPLEDDRWEFTRRTEWVLDTQLYYPLGRDNGVGVFAKYTNNDYQREILADSTGWQFGAVVDWSLGERTAISATVGYDMRDFDEANTLRFINGNFADILEGNNFFYSIEILNLLGDTFNHKLAFTRAIGFGRVTNEQVSTTISYDFLYEGIRNVDLTGGLQWITSEDSGPAPFAEDYDLFMANLGLDIELTESLNSKVLYRYVDKTSDNSDRDFEQSLASISLHYDF